MFRLEVYTQERGDCTCGYNVILDKEYTVREFVETVLTERDKEWGYIGIYSNDNDFSAKVFGEPHCEYKWGELITGALPTEFLDKKIAKATGDGGWSRMDYILWVE